MQSEGIAEADQVRAEIMQIVGEDIHHGFGKD
jgi:hypothetical protein